MARRRALEKGSTVSDEDPKIEITDEDIDSLSEMRKRVCVARACKDLEIDYDWTNDGDTIQIDADLDEILAEGSDFWERWYHHAKTMVLEDTFASLLEKGFIEVAGVDEDGHTLYQPTDKEGYPDVRG